MNNELTWKKYYPLSDKNAFICLVDHMGNDNAIVQAARVSFDGDARFGIAISDKVKKKVLTDKEFNTLLENVRAILKTSMLSWDDEPTYKIFYNNEESVSIQKTSNELNTVIELYEQQRIDDRQLIRYLMNHSHTTPFEMVEIKFMVQVPMDCWRQWIRHRTANVNEYSTRYTEAIDAFQVTQPTEWRLQSTNNKQGSSGFINGDVDQNNENIDHSLVINSDEYSLGIDKTDAGSLLSNEEELFHKMARNLYKLRLDLGIAKEQARKDLPLSTYTRAYWKCDLHNIFHFLRLRMDPHAQLEIRSFANCMYEIVKQICPVACEAFEDYVLDAKKFSRMEMEQLRAIVKHYLFELGEEAGSTWMNIEQIGPKPSSMTDREWKEFLAKLS